MKTGAFFLLLAAACADFALGVVPSYVPPVMPFTVRSTVSGGAALWSITSGGGVIVTVGTSGTILTSSDGITWAAATSGVTDWLVGVCYGGGQFVAVGDNGRILVSPNGVNWTLARSSGNTPRLNNVIYTGSQYVAVGEQGTIVTSPDGQNWTARNSGVTGWLRGLTQSTGGIGSLVTPGGLIASGEGYTLLTSRDGVTWSIPGYTIGSLSGGPSGGFEALVPMHSYSALAGIGDYGLALDTEVTATPAKLVPPAMTTQLIPYQTGFTTSFRALASGGDELFAGGDGGTILESADSTLWVAVPSGTTNALYGSATIGNTLYFVGANQTILQSGPISYSRLINISTLGATGAGSSIMAAGFVINGASAKQMLLRGAGPSLAGFGVAGAVTNPALTLFNSSDAAINTDAGWGAQANASAIAAAVTQTGAFPFAAGSADSALWLTLPSGTYTMQVTDATGANGMSLIEAYDGDSLQLNAPAAVNISTRGLVTPAQPMTAGFVIGGNSDRTVLIRGVGPSLTQFGISNVLPTPQLAVFGTGGAEVASTSGVWSMQLSYYANPYTLLGDFRATGAFALTNGTYDAALDITLPPGSYSVQLSSGDTGSGVALIEVYDVPPGAF